MNIHKMIFLGLAMGLGGAGAALQAGDAAYSVALDPSNSFSFFVLRGTQPILNGHWGEWGNKASFVAPPRSNGSVVDGKLSITGDSLFDKTNHLGHAVTMAPSSPTAILWKGDLTTGATDVSLTHLAFILHTMGGGVTLFAADGTQTDLPYPLKGQAFQNISKIDFQVPGSDSEKIEVVWDSPKTVSTFTGGDIHISLAGNGWNAPPVTLPAGSTQSYSCTIACPGSVSLVGGEAFIKTMADASWFEFKPADFASPGPLAMDDWLEKPAGKHGGVRMVGDLFQFEDGTPVKFWGTQYGYQGGIAPTHENAEKVAAFLARYGVNSVRIGPIANVGWMGIGDPSQGEDYNPQMLERFDYFMSQLASRGIYYHLTMDWSFPVLPADKDHVIAYDEIANLVNPVSKQKGQGTVALINFAPDVQDLLIQKVVNLLQHKNPYTGKDYAGDPAVCCLEIQNEDDIFWFTTEAAFKSCPTYAKALSVRYAAWLKNRYGSQDGLRAAWGDACGPDENIDSATVKLQVAPWMFGTDNLAKAQGGARVRLLDNALFLHTEQDAYYAKFAKAVRAAGYQGPLVGSNWQAPEMVPHYYNLLSDAGVGYIDRHDYFQKGIFGSMLADPGSGMLSAGLQQVGDRPFGLTEWIEVYPDCYRAEGPPLMAAYGMGLQGWDALYENQSHVDPLMNKLVGNLPWGVWEVDTPTQIGQFPLLARMIYRGDVKQGDIISTRNVSASELAKGQFSFNDDYKQQGDIKDFSGSVPPSALAAGRCVVQFTEQPAPSVLPDMSKLQNGTVITSNTGQLKWDSADKGFFTINTAGTKGLVGFAQDKPQSLGAVTITSHSPFASIILTAADKTATLDNAATALFCAVARESNTGFAYSALDESVANNGQSPILLEPVHADITIANRAVQAVNILDAGGNRTGKTVAVANGSFHIDTGQDKTIYYEIVFK